MRAPASLRSHFALLIAFLVAALSWLLGALINQQSSQRLRDDIGRHLAESSYQMIERLDRDMAGRASNLQVLSSLRTVREPQSIAEVRQLLDRLQQEMPSIAWIGYTDAQGKVLASSNGILEGVSIAQRPVYLEALKGQFIGDVHEAVLLAKLLPNPTGEAMKFVDISLPIHTADGQLRGVLATHLSWRWADEVRRKLFEPMQLRRHVEFMVLSKDHSVLLGPKNMIGQTLDLPALRQARDTPSFWAEQKWPDGQTYLTGFAASRGYDDYAGLGWIVLARQPLSEAYAPAKALSLNILLWGSLLAVLFAAAGWLLTGYLTRPLQQIAGAADRLSAGEKIAIPDLDRPREIAMLSQSIRHLVDSLTHQQTALNLMDDRAHSDPLTSLPNRAAVERYLPRVKAEIQAGDGCLALLYLDLDDFKPINDQLGHAAGDELLKEVARRLRAGLREGDLVARLGGDEFLMLLRIKSDEPREQVRLVAERTLQALSEPFDLDGETARVGCSIGGALWPLDHAALEETLELADQALYRAKHAGRNRAEFQATLTP